MLGQKNEVRTNKLGTWANMRGIAGKYFRRYTHLILSQRRGPNCPAIQRSRYPLTMLFNTMDMYISNTHVYLVCLNVVYQRNPRLFSSGFGTGHCGLTNLIFGCVFCFDIFLSILGYFLQTRYNRREATGEFYIWVYGQISVAPVTHRQH